MELAKINMQKAAELNSSEAKEFLAEQENQDNQDNQNNNQ